MGLVVLLMLFAASWLLLIRPQQQRLRAQRALIESLEVGDRVVTAGGIIGTVVGLTDRDAEVAVAPGVQLTFLRAAMSRRLTDEVDDADEIVEAAENGLEEEGA
jgi:preprotein translocase subunit YajC